jgi:hypothetical protein
MEQLLLLLLIYYYYYYYCEGNNGQVNKLCRQNVYVTVKRVGIYSNYLSLYERI